MSCFVVGYLCPCFNSPHPNFLLRQENPEGKDSFLAKEKGEIFLFDLLNNVQNLIASLTSTFTRSRYRSLCLCLTLICSD